jgi:leader peptidase (prepilin peptidase)/N-methyltransferase
MSASSTTVPITPDATAARIAPNLVLKCAMGLAALIAFALLPPDRAVVGAFAGAVLVLLAAIDIEHGIIPNRIVLPATAVVLLAQLALFPGQALEWVLAGLACALALLIPNLLGRSVMGMGDVKLGLLIGVSLGWSAIVALLLGFLLTFPVALALLIRKGLAARKATMPFGPFLALGALLVLFVPHIAG